MKSKTIALREEGVSLKQASAFLLRLLEDQITHYNERQLAAWERNHTAPRKEEESRMTYLREQKNTLKSLLQEADTNSESVDFVLSLDVVIRSKEPETAR